MKRIHALCAPPASLYRGAHPTQGRPRIETAPFDLGGMVRDAVAMMEMRAREKDLRLHLDQPSKFPRYIKGDEARPRQVLINLIGNAAKFTEQGGVTMRLGLRRNTPWHRRIEIEDTGPGIAAEERPRLFEPCIQLGKVKCSAAPAWAWRSPASSCN